MFYVYILSLDGKKNYIGYSSNLKQRLEEHKRRIVPTTMNSSSFQLVFYAAFKNKKKALDFEKYLKTNSGFAFRNKRLLDK